METIEMLKEAMALLYEVESKSKIKSKAMQLYDIYAEEININNKKDHA